MPAVSRIPLISPSLYTAPRKTGNCRATKQPPPPPLRSPSGPGPLLASPDLQNRLPPRGDPPAGRARAARQRDGLSPPGPGPASCRGSSHSPGAAGSGAWASANFLTPEAGMCGDQGPPNGMVPGQGSGGDLSLGPDRMD